MQTPILLIDIDGVISLFGFDPASPPDGKYLLVDGIPHFLSTAAVARIQGLQADFELVWCSGWEERADEHLPHALGLPSGLPHLSFDAAAGDGRHWKLAAIDAYAGPHRPLAWIDDAFDETCHRWAADRPGPTELVATDPAVGLTAVQAERLRRWARSIERAVPPGTGTEALEA
jgi:HAD domain in Swiss Army Knife RNA repair proteins